LRFRVDVPADLEVIRDEADRADEDVADTARVQVLQVVEDVWPEPRLTRGRLGLVREGPLGQVRGGGDETRGLEELLLVGVALVEDAGRERVRGEDDVRVGAADARREEVDEPIVVVPALDEDELGAAGER
jgi:hypothetical protein